jgi:hypothetical protein
MTRAGTGTCRGSRGTSRTAWSATWRPRSGSIPVEGSAGAHVWIILHGSINNAPVWDYTAGLRRSTPEIDEMFAGTAEDATLGTKRHEGRRRLPHREVHDPVTDELDNTGLPVVAAVQDLRRSDADRPDDPGQGHLTYPVPFATYIVVDRRRRPAATVRARVRRSVFFSFTYVGETRTQAKWAGELLRARLKNHRPVLLGHKCWPISILTGGSQRVRRDDAVMRPDGSPLFYGIDDYAVSITIN